MTPPEDTFVCILMTGYYQPLVSLIIVNASIFLSQLESLVTEFEIISELQILFQEDLENVIKITHDNKIYEVFVLHCCGLR